MLFKTVIRTDYEYWPSIFLRISVIWKRSRLKWHNRNCCSTIGWVKVNVCASITNRIFITLQLILVMDTIAQHTYYVYIYIYIYIYMCTFATGCVCICIYVYAVKRVQIPVHVRTPPISWPPLIYVYIYISLYPYTYTFLFAVQNNRDETGCLLCKGLH